MPPNFDKHPIDTIKSRVQIGFPSDKQEWSSAPAQYDGNTLRIAGHPVMEDWEQDYMTMLAKIATSRGGKVLELGYGMGLSAAAIQTHEIDAHVIIECHPDVVKKCVDDFKDGFDNGNIHLMTGYWQDVTPYLASESFEGILFDTYPLREEEIHSNHFWFFEEAHRLLKKGGVLTYYSDEATSYSQDHMQKLIDAGFEKAGIDFELCNVQPPKDCEYWQAPTILAPIVHKR